MIDQLYREGRLYTQEEPIEVFDHDWKSLAQGIAIPHGLYDLALNLGFIHIGTSHDTSEFACDAIGHWWRQYGRVQYPAATSILLLCDGGGSNTARQYLFKQDLQALVNDIAWRFGLLTIDLTPRSTTPLNIAYFHTLLVFVKVSFLRVSRW
ncbi:hypothetical protein IQ238_20070 [Pleurocapsales cyanobacterium LEGE 06147]|nr:hypothetical protein [Pleurocapsales cyanobacterium LEGE 06147]